MSCDCVVLCDCVVVRVCEDEFSPEVVRRTCWEEVGLPPVERVADCFSCACEDEVEASVDLRVWVVAEEEEPPPVVVLLDWADEADPASIKALARMTANRWTDLLMTLKIKN